MSRKNSHIHKKLRRLRREIEGRKKWMNKNNEKRKKQLDDLAKYIRNNFPMWMWVHLDVVKNGTISIQELVKTKGEEE